MLNAAIVMSLIIGWALGFVTYFGVRTGYHLLKTILEEENTK
ncbi:hypothetical protein [Desemzia sp. C1]|nr:hypothetical protein [Desemzia sp. C1]